MVQMFANMTDPSKLGPFMAGALLATFYGATIANLICLPLATNCISSWSTKRSTARSSSTAS